MQSIAAIKILLLVLTITIALGCFTSARANTLDDYRSRLSRALATVQQLHPGSDEDPIQNEQLPASAIAQIKTELPAHETILLTSQAINIDNQWLHDALNDYAKAKSGAERSARLAATGQRLLAIIQRIDELRQSARSGEGKDESKARLAEILRRPEYNQKAAEGSALARLWETFIRWLSSLFPQTKPLQPGSARLASRIAQIVVLALSVGVIALLLWKFVPRYLRNRDKKKKKSAARIVLGERLEPDQTASDLLAEADSLARSGDLRAAIRKAYIALLCELGDRKLISLAQHKTNRDYLVALRNRPTLFAPMKNLTNSFELHWYGFVPPGEQDWNAFRNGYEQALMAQFQR